MEGKSPSTIKIAGALSVIAIIALAVYMFVSGMQPQNRIFDENLKKAAIGYEPRIWSGSAVVRPAMVTAGERITWKIQITLGEEGLATGGKLMFRFPHYYFASRPPKELYQTTSNKEPGWSEAFGPNGKLDIRFRPVEYGRSALFITNSDVPIKGGETVDLVIKNIEGPRTAGDDFEFLLLADPLGENKWGRIVDVNLVTVTQDKPESVFCVAQSIVRPGETPDVSCRLQDKWRNPTGRITGTVTAAAMLNGISTSSKAQGDGSPFVHFNGPELDGEGVTVPEVTVQTTGGEFRTFTNAVLVENSRPGKSLIWGDIHGHSSLSDGRGSPENYYPYARDVSFLTVASLTDHDWQMTEEEFNRALNASQVHYEPGRFVTIHGMETNLAGHETAYFFDMDKLASVKIGRHGGAQDFWHELYAGVPESTPFATYKDLLATFGEKGLIIVPHTTYSKDMGTPLGEPLPLQHAMEIYSAHGSSECGDCPMQIDTGGSAASSIIDWLNDQNVFAILASGDSHDGRPGNTLFSAWPGGLTGFYVESVDRKGVYNAIKERNTFATSGCRAIPDFSINSKPMGSVFDSDSGREIKFRVVMPNKESSVTIFKNGKPYHTNTSYENNLWRTVIDEDKSRSWYYLRAVSDSKDCVVWTSPIWVNARTAVPGG